MALIRENGHFPWLDTVHAFVRLADLELCSSIAFTRSSDDILLSVVFRAFMGSLNTTSAYDSLSTDIHPPTATSNLLAEHNSK